MKVLCAIGAPCSDCAFLCTVCKVVCRAVQAHPDKQHVLVGVVAAFVQPEQDGDRDIGSRPPGTAFVSPAEVLDVRLQDV